MTMKKWKKKMIGLTASNGDRLWQTLVRKKDWKANPDPASHFPSRYFPPESSEFVVDGVVELRITADALSGDSFFPGEWVYRGSDL